MSIFSDFSSEPTNERRPVRVALVCVETDQMMPGGDRSAWGHKLTLTIETKFWANQAQYRDAQRAASRVILHALYKNTLRQVDETVHALMGDDIERALSVLNNLRKELVE